MTTTYVSSPLSNRLKKFQRRDDEKVDNDKVPPSLLT